MALLPQCGQRRSRTRSGSQLLVTKTERTNRREENATNTLAFIKQYWKEHGFGPSYRDIEDAVKISAGSATISVATLVENGLISVEPGVARSIRPTPRKKGNSNG